jgi:hypothetical protein
MLLLSPRRKLKNSHENGRGKIEGGGVQGRSYKKKQPNRHTDKKSNQLT